MRLLRAVASKVVSTAVETLNLLLISVAAAAGASFPTADSVDIHRIATAVDLVVATRLDPTLHGRGQRLVIGKVFLALELNMNFEFLRNVHQEDCALHFGIESASAETLVFENCGFPQVKI